MTALWDRDPVVGQSHRASLSAGVTRSDVALYAGASGDANLVHVDDDYARAAGHPHAIVHGMLTMGLTGAWVTALVGHHHLRSFGGRFLKPVVMGDALHCEAIITAIAEDGLRLDLSFTTTRTDGTPVLRGYAVAARDFPTREDAP